jgi:hypothetical protein
MWFLFKIAIMTPIIGSNGKALKDAKPEVLADGVNPKSIAARMTRARWIETRGGFNWKLDYQPGLALAIDPAAEATKSASRTGDPRKISILKTCPVAGCDLIRSNKQSPNRMPRGSPAKSRTS